MTSARPLVAAEVRKLLSVRSSRAFVVVAVAFAALSFAPAWTAPGAERRALAGDTLVDILRGPGLVVAVLMLLMHAFANGAEYRHGMTVATLAVRPRRTPVVASKLAAAAAVAGATAVAVQVVAATLGVAFLGANGITSTASIRDLVATSIAAVAVAVLYGVIGAALGVALRDPTAAVGSALVWLGMVEGVIPVVLRRAWLFRWMPSGAANAVLGVADPPPDLLPATVGAMLVTAIAVAAAAVAVLSFTTRDVDVS